MTCNRCQPDRLCLNHAAEAKSRAFIRAREEREMILELYLIATGDA
jgi:hypothetical protein